MRHTTSSHSLQKKTFYITARRLLLKLLMNDVRDVINVSSAEVPDAKALKMIKRAEVTPSNNGSRGVQLLQPHRPFDSE